MKYFLRQCLLIGFFALFALPIYAQTQPMEEIRFVPGTEDIPLMDGLSIISEAPMRFDMPDGRVVESLVSGNVAIQDLKDYYNENLPQLGWQKISDDAALGFARGNEMLTITAEVAVQQDNIFVRFNLSPVKVINVK